MNVEYFHEIPGLGNGNVMWRGKHPMRGGVFPADHPASPKGKVCSDYSQLGDTEKMTAFRERGYWASCFPEGDGITMACGAGQDAAKVAADLAEVFGWTVTVKRT